MLIQALGDFFQLTANCKFIITFPIIGMEEEKGLVSLAYKGLSTLHPNGCVLMHIGLWEKCIQSQRMFSVSTLALK